MAKKAGRSGIDRVVVPAVGLVVAVPVTIAVAGFVGLERELFNPGYGGSDPQQEAPRPASTASWTPVRPTITDMGEGPSARSERRPTEESSTLASHRPTTRAIAVRNGGVVVHACHPGDGPFSWSVTGGFVEPPAVELRATAGSDAYVDVSRTGFGVTTNAYTGPGDRIPDSLSVPFEWAGCKVTIQQIGDNVLRGVMLPVS